MELVWSLLLKKDEGIVVSYINVFYLFMKKNEIRIFGRNCVELEMFYFM